MQKPIVAIVGRPNVGKSTLFNKLAGARISIVEDSPGVTRDRIYADCEWLKYDFTLIDTGGLDLTASDFIMKQIVRQAEIAIETADVIIFLLDVKSGLLEADKELADILRRAKKPVIPVINKVDDMRKENLAIYEFYSLGFGEPVPISSSQSLGLGDMLDEVVKHFPDPSIEEEEDNRIKVAIIGRPNVGKSSLVNKILGEERVIVSDVPGTTRDSIDTYLEKDGKTYVLIDTAGIRRKSRIKEDIERYSIVRAVAAVERANVCVVVLDATQEISEQDTKIAGIAHERGKPIIIAVNKWDMIEKDTKTMNAFLKNIENVFSFMSYSEKIFISAATGQRVTKLLDFINAVYENSSMRVNTGVLNEVLIEAMAAYQPPADRGKQLRIYYMTQVSVRPPTFVMFVNSSKLMHFSYKRYIENQIRQAFGFKGTPVHFILRNKEE